MSALLAAIRNEHTRLADRLSLLKAEILKAASGAPDHERLVLLARYFETFPDKIHHAKEHRLYHALIRIGVPEDAYLRRLKDEHRRMEEISARFCADLSKLEKLNRKPSAFLVKRVLRFIEIQELHMKDEESQFLPLAEQRLSADRLSELDLVVARDAQTAEAVAAATAIAQIDREIGALDRAPGT